MARDSILKWSSHEESDHFKWIHQVEPSLGDPAVWRDYYDITASKALRELEASDVWMDVLTAIADFGSAYRAAWGSALVVDPPRLVSKPFNSIRNKVYRANVVERAEAPTSAELVTPTNWYSRLGDILRCTIVVSMMDGVAPLCDAIVASLVARNKTGTWQYRSKLRGYHAAHLSFDWPLSIVLPSPPPRRGSLSVEIQVKTHLHHVLGQLTHDDYALRRSTPSELDSDDWMWRPDGPLFHPRMLGHVVQFLDGAIVRIKKGDTT